MELAKRPQKVVLWDFIIKLLKLKDSITSQEYDTIFIIINKFIKQGYFIIYIKEILVENIIKIYIKEVFAKYKVLNKIILDRDIKFIAVFQKVFIVKQRIKIVILIVYYP